ncbi:hypothetical protein M0812_07814 [Anaeramoeba flamelloides]|uniref:PAS domain-containing protein n=1 Tax=Anaeramoeba flamelloides TaxID=1746091 RepID=A0AAV8A4J8_9EUKA|nr:hypothetical protein M0812_07814 [Anaeramoeba flamelloides]
MGNVNSHKTLSKSSWRKYKKMISKSKEAILLIDDKTNFTFINRAALRMLNIKKNKKVNITPAMISPLRQEHLGVDSKSGSEAVVKRVYESKTGKIDFIWQHQTITGELFYVRVYLTILKVEDQINCQVMWRPVSDPNDEKTDGSIDPRFVNIDVSESENGSESQSKTSTLGMESFSTQTNQNISSKMNNTTTNTQRTEILLDVGEIDIDDEFLNFQDKAKNIVRSTNNSTAEKKIIEEFQKFEKIFYQALESRDVYIKKILEKSHTAKSESRKKYRELENHLQKILGDFKIEKQQREESEKQNQKMKLQLKEVKSALVKQKKIFKKLTSIIVEENVENNTNN